MSYIEARKAEAEAARQRQEELEMRECTFKPNLKPSQRSYKCYRSYVDAKFGDCSTDTSALAPAADGANNMMDSNLMTRRLDVEMLEFP